MDKEIKTFEEARTRWGEIYILIQQARCISDWITVGMLNAEKTELEMDFPELAESDGMLGYLSNIFGFTV